MMISNRMCAASRASLGALALALAVSVGVTLPIDTAHAQQPAVTWKLHGDQGATFWWSQELAAFAKKVGEATNGKMKLDFYPAAALGVAPPSILAPVRAGAIEMAEFVASYVAGEAPYLTVAGLPMIASSPEHGYRITKAILPEIEKELADKYDLLVLGTLSSSPLQLYLGKTEWRGVETLKGLRIRTLGPDQEFFVRSLGATPVQVPIADFVSAIATNRVDGGINGTQYLVSQKISQYGPTLVAWNAVLGPGFLVVGKSKWATLAPDMQQAVMKAAKDFERQIWTRAETLEKEVQTEGTAQGLKIVNISDADRDTLTARAKEAWAGWAQRSGALARRLLEVAQATK